MVRFLSTLLLLCPAALALQIPFGAPPPSLPLSYISASASLAPVLDSLTNAFIEETLSQWKSSGLAVAVVRQDRDGLWKVETRGYGVENHKGKKMSSNSLFSIASNSKLFTSMAAGLLVHNDSVELEWDTKMKDVVPGFALMDGFASEKASLRDFLAHQGGLPRHDMMPSANMSISTLISRIKHLRPSAELRQHWQYNNLGYMLAAHLPSFLLPSRPSFGAYLQEHIFGPLGMTSTFTSVAQARKTGHLSDGFTRTNVSLPDPLGELRPLPFFLADNAGDINSGAGGVITSTKDIALWLQTLLLEGEHPSHPNVSVLPFEAVRSVSTGVSVRDSKGIWPEIGPTVYGAGCMISSYRGHQIISHSGSVPGFLTTIARLPDDTAGIAVFSNDDVYGVQIYETIKYTLIDRMLGLEKIDWSKRYQDNTNNTLYSAPGPAPQPSNPVSPSLSLASIPGTYLDEGYGSIELCLVSDPSSATNLSSSSTSCAALRAGMDLVLPGAIKKNVLTFLARVGAIFSTHLRLEHFDGNLFNVTSLSSLPSLTNATDFFAQHDADYTDTIAELVVGFKEDGSVSVGLGLSGGVWGAGAGVKSPKGETVRERAEVFFEKV